MYDSFSSEERFEPRSGSIQQPDFLSNKAALKLQKLRVIESQRYQKILFKLWIDRVKETGNLDYQPLEKHLRQVDTIRKAPEGALLFSEQVAVKIANLERAENKIDSSVSNIKQILNRLSANIDDCLDDQIREELDSNLLVLEKNVRYIINLCVTYELVGEAFIALAEQEIYYKKKQTEIETLIINSYYTLAYLIEFVQLHKIYSGLSLVDEPNCYFNRTRHYLTVVGKSASKLSEIIKDNIAKRDVSKKKAEKQL